MPRTQAALLQGCGSVPRAGTRNAFENGDDEDENENGRRQRLLAPIDSPDNRLNFFN
jgi:hypothetical protein